MRVQDVMTNRVHTVSPEISAQDAWNVMQARRVHHLVVMNAGRVVGLLSAGDLGGPKGERSREHHTAGDLMSRRVATVSPSTPVRRAANLMRSRAIESLVVTERTRLAGIVTAADLLELIGRGTERPVAATKRPSINHRVPHRKRHVAFGAW